MGRKSGGTSTTTQKVEPPEYLKPSLASAASAADTWFKQNQSLWAAPNMNWFEAGNRIREQAVNANQTLQPAWQASHALATGDFTRDNPLFTGKLLADDPTASGAYLGKQNPWLADLVEQSSRPVVEQFQNSIAPSLASQFSAAGRMGSGAHLAAAGQAQTALGRQLGDISTGIYGRAYESERDRMAQEQAAGRQAMYGAWGDVPKLRLAGAAMMPSLMSAENSSYAMLGDYAEQERQIEQERLSDPMRRVMAYNQMIGMHPNVGTTTTTQTQPGGSRLMGGLGGSLMGAGLAGAMGVAAAPFALLGGAAGLFG
jgi:hypothetical protein